MYLISVCVKPWSQGWLIAAGAYPGFFSMKRLEVFLLPLDGMLVHRRSLPRNFVRFPQQIAGTHLYTWVERGTVRVKYLAQEHNTLSLARSPYSGPVHITPEEFKNGSFTLKTDKMFSVHRRNLKTRQSQAAETLECTREHAQSKVLVDPRD